MSLLDERLKDLGSKSSKRPREEEITSGSSKRLRESKDIRDAQQKKTVVKLIVCMNPTSVKDGREGSGFFITKEGVIITNAHLFPPAHATTVTVLQEEVIIGAAYLLAASYESDLAVLLFNKKDLDHWISINGQIPEWPFVDVSTLSQKDKVEVFSYHGNSKMSVYTDGKISCLRVFMFRHIPNGIPKKRLVCRMSCPTNGGSSGAPVFLKRNDIIGVVSDQVTVDVKQPDHFFPMPNTHVRQFEQNASLFIPINDLKDFFKCKAPEMPREIAESCLKRVASLPTSCVPTICS